MAVLGIVDGKLHMHPELILVDRGARNLAENPREIHLFVHHCTCPFRKCSTLSRSQRACSTATTTSSPYPPTSADEPTRTGRVNSTPLLSIRIFDPKKYLTKLSSLMPSLSNLSGNLFTVFIVLLLSGRIIALFKYKVK